MSVEPASSGLGAVRAMVAAGGVTVLSGAGLSTESGIPDYRGPTGIVRRHTPMTYQTFIGRPEARRRYWARSHLGWRQIDEARPNAGHNAVARLQRLGLVDAIITQNVDGLHQAAGAERVVELHGGLAAVVCLGCGGREPRRALDERLRALNADFAAVAAGVNPDGDAELSDADLDDFVVAPCALCGSDLLKPDVVFFGESVPRERVDGCFAQVASARGLLVLGSSLTVMSGLRFVRRAHALGVPVAIVNQGETRGDQLAAVKVDAALGVALTELVSQLAPLSLA